MHNFEDCNLKCYQLKITLYVNRNKMNTFHSLTHLYNKIIKWKANTNTYTYFLHTVTSLMYIDHAIIKIRIHNLQKNNQSDLPIVFPKVEVIHGAVKRLKLYY